MVVPKNLKPRRFMSLLMASEISFFEIFFGYADRLHSGYLTLQCQTKGSMGERS